MAKVKNIQQAYHTVLLTEAGQEVMKDLVIFSQQRDIDPARALGRAEVVMRMLREQQRASEPEPKYEEQEE